MLEDHAETADQLVLSSFQAGRRIGLSDSKMRQMRLDGSGPAFIVLTLNRVGYTPESIAAWLATRTPVLTTAEAEKQRAAMDKARKAAFGRRAAA